VIEVRTGDLLASEAQTLVNPVNIVGVAGAGLAAQFTARFPDMAADYRARCRRGELRLGEPDLWRSLLPPQIVLFPTKGDWRDCSRIVDIHRGMRYLVGHLQAWDVTSLAVPALGCGNGGLGWPGVAALLHRHLADLDIPVQVYAPHGAPPWQATVGFLARPGTGSSDGGGHQIGHAVRCGRGGRVPPGAIYVGRRHPRAGLPASPLANPFRLQDPDDPADRRHCLERYREWLYDRALRDPAVRATLEQARGHDLACWCSPRPCHAELILAWLLRHPTADDLKGQELAEQLGAVEAALTPTAAACLAVVGSASFADPAALWVARTVIVDELLRLHPTRLVSGAADRIGQLAGRLGRELGISVAEHLPTPAPPPPRRTASGHTGLGQRNDPVADGCSALLRVACRQSRSDSSSRTADHAEALARPVGRVVL